MAKPERKLKPRPIILKTARSIPSQSPNLLLRDRVRASGTYVSSKRQGAYAGASEQPLGKPSFVEQFGVPKKIAIENESAEFA